MMTSYKNDPRKFIARFNSVCSKCGIPVKKGITGYYFPATGKVMCDICGEPEYRQFLSMAADEDVFNGIGNPY
jgi:hypothetical protein